MELILFTRISNFELHRVSGSSHSGTRTQSLRQGCHLHLTGCPTGQQVNFLSRKPDTRTK